MIDDPMIEAMSVQYREEVAKLNMQLVLYRETLINHGIEPPDESGEELLKMWKDCRSVISTASHFVANLRSAKELLGEKYG